MAIRWLTVATEIPKNYTQREQDCRERALKLFPWICRKKGSELIFAAQKTLRPFFFTLVASYCLPFHASDRGGHFYALLNDRIAYE